jgi:group I intron endonuclease
MNACYIYKITNKIDGKFYIGSTEYPERRFKEHATDLNKGRHHSLYLQRAWDKYGEDNFKFEILRYCTRNKRRVYEQHFLDRLRPYDYEIGYNMNRKVDSRYGRKMSKEACLKMSIAKKGKPSVRKGCKLSEETRKKLSESHKGQVSWLKGTKGKIVAWNKGISPSQVTRQRMSESLKGKKAWNKGIPASDEHRRKLSIAAKKRPSNRKGKTWSNESKQRFSLILKESWRLRKEKYATA